MPQSIFDCLWEEKRKGALNPPPMATINQRLLPTISLTDYCYNKMIRFATTYVISGDREFYVLRGVEYTVPEFHAMFPVPSKLTYRENSDASKKWLEDY